METIQCRCGNVIGQIIAGIIVVRHRKREIAGRELTITCEVCRHVWQPGDPLRPVEARPARQP